MMLCRKLLLLMLGMPMISYADDIEVYANPSTVETVPNLLFVFDSSSSMNKTPLGESPGDEEPSRLDILKTSVDQILSQDFDGGLNIGYMDFRNGQGNGIKFPVSGIDSDAHEIDPEIPANTTVRQVIRNLVNANSATGQTPTVESLYEAALYFRGDAVLRGRAGSFGHWDTNRNPPHYHGGNWKAANPASYTGERTSSMEYLASDTPLEDGVREKTCRDYSARPNSNRNDCAAIPDDKLYGCQSYGVQECTEETYDRCAEKSYPVVAACLNGPGNNETPWLNSNSRKCCTNADITNSECLTWKNLEQCDRWEDATHCVGGRNENQVYRECKYRYRKTTEDSRTYKSPIGMQCQKNAIILLSDGAPSKNNLDYGRTDNQGRAKWPYYIRRLIYNGTNAIVPQDEKYPSLHDVTCADLSTSVFTQESGQYRWGNCGPELVEFLHERDQKADLDNSTVETYTIGFGLNGTGASQAQEYLRLLATKGGGEFYEADDVTSLVSSISSIISAITSNNQSLTGISLSVNANRLSTSKKTYIGQFVPSSQRSWEGNIKGYFLGSNGLLDVNGDLAVTEDGQGAKFEATAQSFWSEAPDGANVVAGGLQGKLDPDNRTIYVNTSDTAPSELKLSDNDALLFDDDNTSLTAEMMGLPSSANADTRSALIEWARSAPMKAPLHATPTVVHYGGDRGDVLFAMTNQGFLHAFDVTHPTTTGDTTGGNELFAFMPRALISNLAAMKANGSSGSHIYGLDGPITVLSEDSNEDGELNPDDGDRVILYFGMRRGGGNYYAMDVSNPEDPVLLWRIDPTQSGFSALGQSWSRMVLTTIKDGDGARKVLVFGAGYDTDQDSYAQRHADDTGAGLYVIDAYTGSLIMSIGGDSDQFIKSVSGMDYSIPAEPRVIDLNDDDIADRIYIGDMGAQIWSIDLPQGAEITDADNYMAHKTADLGGSSVADTRRFYYPPAIARVARNGGQKLAIALGSGFRAHPLNNAVSDRFFVVFDDIEKNAEELPSEITETDLFDLSDDLIGPGADPEDVTVAKTALATKKGWFMTLPSGNKVISEARILAGSVMFNTFSADGSICEGVKTQNNFYLVSLLAAEALIDLDETEEDVRPDRSVLVDYSGIATAPSLVFTDPTNNSSHLPTMDIYVGQEKILSQAERIYKVVWESLN